MSVVKLRVVRKKPTIGVGGAVRINDVMSILLISVSVTLIVVDYKRDEMNDELNALKKEAIERGYAKLDSDKNFRWVYDE